MPFAGLGDETLAPPLIVGEDAFDFNAAVEQPQYLFGDGQNAAAAANFDFSAPAYQQLPPSMPKLDTNWTMMPDAQPPNVSLPALSTAPSQHSFPGPASVTAPSAQYSPASSSQRNTTGTSETASPPQQAPPKKRGGRKRKVDVEPPREENGDSQDGDEPPIKKTSHNVIEKRYRNNLNDKIVELRNAVPALRAMGRANKGEESEDLEGLTPAHKLNKATVMGKATEYIRHLEKRNKNMAEEMAQLKARLDAVEAAIGKTASPQTSVSGSPPSSTMRPRQSSAASQAGTQAFLNVPQQQVVPQQYMPPQQQPIYAQQPRPPVEAQNQPQYVYGRGGGGGGGAMGKVMMGAMAGIMVMEGFTEQDGDARQMFAAPTALFRRGLDVSTSSPAAMARQATVPLLKVCCILGALLYLTSPLLSFSPRRKTKARPTLRLSQAPSLASPVEVRRKAWLTALQTVYVPKHFLLEVAAVTAKMMSLSIRRLIGAETWNAITGTNKEEEAARNKAWDIAIDAQLAGGDAEVSYYRLLLTLMASGTLPDSPTRLMQKAVHFRVFFWEVANAGYGNILGFKTLTEKVGKIYWDSARKLQKELVHAQSQGRPLAPGDEDELELLPDHLAGLLDLDCDDVLTDEMIQRAWNLAWDKPSAYNASPNAARDGVIEDHAIRSPLDAVAAWYANITIDDTLHGVLGEHPSSLDTEFYLGLAVSVAPPASATHLRALAAKAVLCNSHRRANILAALEALPAVLSDGAEHAANFVQHAPVSGDVHAALTIAKLLSLLSPSAAAGPDARQRAADTIARLSIPPRDLTLLTAVAVYKLLRAVDCAPGLPATYRTQGGLEELAASLRMWVGSAAGGKGMGEEECGRVVEVCLGVVKRCGGWEKGARGRDSAYASAEGSPVRETRERGGMVV